MGKDRCSSKTGFGTECSWSLEALPCPCKVTEIRASVMGCGFMTYEYCGNPNWEMKVGICLGTGKVCKAREKGN